MNAALSGLEVRDEDVLNDRRARLEVESSDLAKMYDTLSGYSLYPKFADCVESLGEDLDAYYGELSPSYTDLPSFACFNFFN